MNTDRITVRVVVLTLAGVVCGGVVAMVALTLAHIAIPDQLDRVVSIALGAIAGLLAKTSTDTPTEVQVINQPNEPVPVEPGA